MNKVTNSGEVNKSQVIRGHRERHPGMGPSETADVLNRDLNLGISAAYVSTIWSQDKQRREHEQFDITKLPYEMQHLLFAKMIAQRMGGVDSAIAALKTLKRLQSGIVKNE